MLRGSTPRQLPTWKRSSVLVPLLAWWTAAAGLALAEESAPIDRRAVVERHNLRTDRYDPRAPASIGNGEFAFTFDVTGLQTFAAESPDATPLATMAQWAWHAFPESQRALYKETLVDFPVHGRTVSYAAKRESPAGQVIRSNPHRFGLARIALRLEHGDGRRAVPDDLVEPRQTVHLWTGEAVSEFTFEGQPVAVRAAVAPDEDTLAVSVESPLVASGRVAIEVDFAYPAGVWGPLVDDWSKPDRHQTELASEGSHHSFSRRLDATGYRVELLTEGRVTPTGGAAHRYAIERPGEASIAAVFHFAKTGAAAPSRSSFDAVLGASRRGWEDFWRRGGAIDLSASADPRWRELERRIVVSQFVTAVNCAGSLPPQETGLVCNSWHGKSHLEMHWWHAAHFALWDRFDLLEKSLGWYERTLPAARAIAQRQGYAGVRWPKMTGPGGISSPSDIGEFLIWQQPHPIYYAELAYRDEPSPETLDRYAEVVEQTAEFMADYAHREADTDRYVLGPVLVPAQECYGGGGRTPVLNPTFELAYWRWALRAANAWRERRGLERNERWAEVAAKLARPTVRGGVYTAIENPPYTIRRDHPSMLGAHGMLPPTGLINPSTMRRTLVDVKHGWDWQTTWGWDYPMIAMTAARLGDGHAAIDALLFDSPKNRYLANGHCYQAERLPTYLPANGGLLSAVAMMAAGWDGADAPTPGFPKDGSWTVRHEGFKRMP